MPRTTRLLLVCLVSATAVLTLSACGPSAPALTTPGAPTITSVSGIISIEGCSARVAFTPPADDGGSPIVGYRLAVSGHTSIPLLVSTSSPITVPGFTRHETNTYTLQAVTSVGDGTPSAPFVGSCT